MDHQYAAARAIPTARSYRSDALLRRGARARRLGVIVLVALVAVGMLGIAGPRSVQRSSTGAGGTLEVEYPSITRPGLDSEITVTLRPDEPSDTYRLTIDSDALAKLGVDRIQPEPDSQISEGTTLVLEFTGSQTDELIIAISGRVPTQKPPGIHDWTLAWPTSSGTQQVTARTWVLP